MYGRRASLGNFCEDNPFKIRRHSEQDLPEHRDVTPAPHTSNKSRRHSVFAHISPVSSGDGLHLSLDSISNSTHSTERFGSRDNLRSSNVRRKRRKSSPRVNLQPDPENYISAENLQNVARKRSTQSNHSRKLSIDHELYNDTLSPGSSSSDVRRSSSPAPKRRSSSRNSLDTIEMDSYTSSTTPRSSPIPPGKVSPNIKMDTLQLVRQKPSYKSLSDISEGSSFTAQTRSSKRVKANNLEVERRKSLRNSRNGSSDGVSDLRSSYKSSIGRITGNQTTSSASMSTRKSVAQVDETVLGVVFKSMTPSEVGLPAFGCRPRKYLWPIVIAVLIMSVIVSLVLAFYFANMLKDKQETQIEYLQAMLTLRLRNLLNGTDINNLPPKRQQALFKSYCEQIDSIYRKSSIRDGYSECRVNKLSNHVINFTLYFSNLSTSKDDIISVIQVTSSNNPNGTLKMTIADDIRLEIYSKNITIKVTTSQQPEITTKPLTSTPYPKNVNYRRKVYPDHPCQNATTEKFHPHPELCNLYIHCDNGQDVIKQCNFGLVFYPEYSQCMEKPADWDCPDMTPCQLKPNGYFAHPYNCSLYIHCDNGYEIIRPCSDGTVWDRDVGTCMPPEDVLASPCKRQKQSILKDSGIQ